MGDTTSVTIRLSDRALADYTEKLLREIIKDDQHKYIVNKKYDEDFPELRIYENGSIFNTKIRVLFSVEYGRTAQITSCDPEFDAAAIDVGRKLSRHCNKGITVEVTNPELLDQKAKESGARTGDRAIGILETMDENNEKTTTQP